MPARSSDSRRSLAALILGACFVLAPASSLAAPKAAAGEAEAAFRRGNVLVDEGNYEAALIEYRRSLSLFPSRSATRNVAASLRKLKRYDEALAVFEGLARDFPPSTRAEKAALEAEIAQLRTMIGTVRITSNQAGAVVTIDGVRRGETPLASFSLATGKHHVRLEKPGFAPLERDVELAGQTTSDQRFDLVALTPATAPVTPPKEPTKGRSVVSTLGFGALGLGLGAGVLGGVALGLREERIGAMNDAGCSGAVAPATANRCDELAGAARTRGTLALVSFVVAGGLVATGLVLQLVAPHPKRTTVALACTPGLGASCTLQF